MSDRGPDSADDRATGKTYNTGVTYDDVVDAALRLTNRHGLETWSTRQLLAEVPTSFSVVYRLVGDREALSAAVADRVACQLACPGPELPWRDWLTELLLSLRVQLLGYPGVAQWFLTRGGTVPSVLPILGTGIDVVARAGFGEEAASAYAYVFTSTVTLIALTDTRTIAAAETSTLSYAAMRDRLEALPESADRVSAMIEFVRDLAVDDEERVQQEHYEYALARALDGLQHRLDFLRSN